MCSVCHCSSWGWDTTCSALGRIYNLTGRVCTEKHDNGVCRAIFKRWLFILRTKFFIVNGSCHSTSCVIFKWITCTQVINKFQRTETWIPFISIISCVRGHAWDLSCECERHEIFWLKMLQVWFFPPETLQCRLHLVFILHTGLWGLEVWLECSHLFFPHELWIMYTKTAGQSSSYGLMSKWNLRRQKSYQTVSVVNFKSVCIFYIPLWSFPSLTHYTVQSGIST